MSTKSQIKIVDSCGDEQWFYRHSDGYPSRNLICLRQFLQWVKEDKIRDNTMQSSGWLVLLGIKEFWSDIGQWIDKSINSMLDDIVPGAIPVYGWKVGSYEPCSPDPDGHGDVHWFYEIGLEHKTIKITRTGDEMVLTDDPEKSPLEMEDMFH